MPLRYCGCCAAFRPRYKKLVDNIFPSNPEDGLVKSNMDKLVWYALHSPDKLDRIGEYLAHRLFRNIHRRRIGNVIIAMDALDQLLKACHANNLNLFVESFLQMIQKLLESQDPMLQLRATQSFEKYADIREDTPTYHRRYDFFVEKFTSMCYSNGDDAVVRQQLRTAGIKGLQGVIRKTDYDDLGDSIWQCAHLDKIVPALLFNMQGRVALNQDPSVVDDGNDHEEKGGKEPHELAEVCFRELVSRATTGKIAKIITPLLHHMDHQKLWFDNTFAIHTFQILMFSIQDQCSVSVIKMLISHLNEKSSSSAKCRIGMAEVLSKVIPIAAEECIGLSVIDIINSLLEQIRTSIAGEKEGGGGGGRGARGRGPQEFKDEVMYQETLIHALGEYANHLPDFQKIESMIFILDKVPGSDRVEDPEKQRPEKEAKLQHLLLKSLLKVATKYTTVQYSTTLSHSFLVRLMRMSVSSDAEVRLTVQYILHTLLDRQDNVMKLSKATIDVGLLKLNTGKLVRQDVNFWKKSGNEILLSVEENCEINNNSLQNIEALYTTLMLFLTEIRHDDVVVDVLRALFHIQNMACNKASGLSDTRRIQLLALVSSVMVAVSHCIPLLKEHVRTVVEKRSTDAPHLLPDLLPHYGSPTPIVDELPREFLYDSEIVLKVLKEANMDERRLTANVSSVMRRPSTFRRQNTISEINSLSIEVNSAASSPQLPKRSLEEEVTFDSLKKALSDSPEKQRKEEEEQRRLITESFMTESFEVMMAKIQQPDALQSKLTEIFSRLPAISSTPPASSSFLGNPDQNSIGINTGAPYQLPYSDIILY